MDYYSKLRDDYKNYSMAPESLKNDPVFVKEALSECIRQCYDKEEEYRRKIFTDFSKYVRTLSSTEYTISNNNGPRVMKKKSFFKKGRSLNRI